MSSTRSAPSHAPLHQSLDLLERAIGYTREQLRVITPEMLRRSTPCVDWSLATLLDHMADSLDALIDAADLRAVVFSLPSGPRFSSVDAVDRLRERACSLVDAWSVVTHDDDVTVGDRALPSSLLACAGALEVAVHGWDVSQTTGAREPIPAGLARDLLTWADVLVTDADRPARFDHPVPGPSVGPSSRLVQLLGREP